MDKPISSGRFISQEEILAAFRRSLDSWVNEHGLQDAVATGDREAVQRACVGMHPRVVEAYMNALFQSHSANPGRKRRRREANVDKIDGDHLAATPAKVTRAYQVKHFKRKLKLDPKQHADAVTEITTEPAIVKEVINLSEPQESVSHDVIFNPTTQSTRYSSQREAKRNLQRRMPDFSIDVLYGSGEGMLRFYAQRSMPVTSADGHMREVQINATCVASPSDMAIRQVEILCDGKDYVIEPADRAMSPEEAVKVLSSMASNIISKQM